MKTSRKVILYALGGVVGFAIFATIGLTIYINASQFKSQLEVTASNQLAVDVAFSGRMSVSLLHGLHVTFKDVHLRNKGEDIASAKSLTVGIALLPLLRDDLQFTDVALIKPVITVEKRLDGEFNITPSGPRPGSSPGLSLPHLVLKDATLVHTNKQFRHKFVAKACDIDAYNFHIAGGADSGDHPMENTGFSSRLHCGEISVDGYQALDLRLAARRSGTDLNMMPITLDVFGARGEGSIVANFARSSPEYQLKFSLPQFPIKSFFDTLAREHTNEQLALGTGTLDFAVDLSMQGASVQEIIRSANGRFSLRGKHLTLNGTDLDSQFEQFESSQHFSLVDVGAFLYAGPLGLLLTKGYDFTGILRASGGQSEISSLVSDWQVESGVARAVDVAMATTKNRVAMHGKLDFVSGRYDDVTVALVDADGCAAVKQEIHGDFQQPEVEQPNILRSLAGPMISLLKMGRNLLGGECDKFYEGSVAAPK